jgi:hypothetical protein
MGIFRLVPAAFLAAAFLSAQPSAEFFPGASYDPSIPTFHQTLGYEPGEKITSHAGILQYLHALAAASGRLKLFEYGESWEGRKLVYAAVGSEGNIRKLPEIRAAMLRLADPRRTSAAEAKRIAAGLPAIVWLSYGVHGNEISSPDAALLTAYHLLAVRDDPMAREILANTVLLLDPVQNPDGRDRFVHHFEQTRGLAPDASPISAEHNEPWPGGRSNHYLFDLNRDWLALTQPEIRGQVAALREWLPLVYVDLHEMGAESSYYFAPEADPYNPHIARTQRESLSLFGRNNAKWFDKFGWDYFTREAYDAFYPGYGASWPIYYGAIATTYEQAGVRGLVVRKGDGSVLRFRDSVQHHFIASLSTAETAAANREKLLADFYAYRASAVEEGKTEAVQEYILPRSRDASATDKLAAILVEHGIEVKRATASFRAGGREYAAGTYVVPLAQPGKRLIRNLLDPNVPLDPAFLKREEERRRLRQQSEIYDVTAWSLPLLFNVEAVPCTSPATGSFEAATAVRIRPGEVHGGKAGLAYLVPWGTQAAGRFLAAALKEDVQVYSSDKPLAVNGTKFPAGTLIVKVKGNPPDLAERMARLARETGAEVSGTDSGWVEDGVNFGSRYVVHVRKPNILLLWDTPASSSAAGATRFVLERQFGYPVTIVRAPMLASVDLARFQVLILPSGGGYAAALSDAAIDHIKDWVEAGGTIVALGEATAFLADKKVELLAILPEDAFREEEPKKPADEKVTHAPGKLLANDRDFEKETASGREPPENSEGFLVRARVRPEHWLTAGAGESVNALVQGRSIYTPIKVDKGVNAAYFDAPDKLVASGFVWPDVLKQLAYKPLVVAQKHDRGIAIGFTADPTFRAMTDGLNVLFLNAVFRAPAHARPPTAED